IISAVIITILPEVLRDFADFRMLVYAVVLIAMMLLNSSEKGKELMAKFNFKNLGNTLKEKTAKKEEATDEK
ncbi:MAG: branched-chain amino acid ABC transporter permease, partial [Firmicutes bacterium]|nr:branched-chain amino acid ABC transporter permease [Bacillota bacterium]